MLSLYHIGEGVLPCSDLKELKNTMVRSGKLGAASVPLTIINWSHKRRADKARALPAWIPTYFHTLSLYRLFIVHPFFLFLSFPLHLWLTFYRFTPAATNTIYCVHRFNIQVSSPLSWPSSTSAHYLFLISPSVWDHPDPPVFPSAVDWGPAWLGVQQTTVIHQVSAEIINTPSMPQHHE